MSLSIRSFFPVFATAFVLTHAGLANAQTPKSLSTEQAAFVKIAKQRLVRELRDPTGVLYRDVFIAEKKSSLSLCGEVNAKNAYGGYSGFSPFVTRPDGDVATIVGGVFSLEFVTALKAEACANKIIDVE